MPIHDWSRVDAWVFHDFHCGWVNTLSDALNNGLLPADFYAMIERSGEEPGPDPFAVPRPRTLVIRQESADDRVVAMIEIVSVGNKASGEALRRFVDQALGSLGRGHHLLILDLHPPSPHAPHGIHGAIWTEAEGESYEAPADKPLTLAAYEAGLATATYVEPVAVGDSLPDMPLFLGPRRCVTVPLEATYEAAWRRVPRRWRDVVEPPPKP